MVTFTNPRLYAEILDYPIGGGKRGKCVFTVHNDPKKGYRVLRTTTGKAKLDTYATKVAIVDGNDGRTYILKFDSRGGSVSVFRHDFMCADSKAIGEDARGSYVYPGDARYVELLGLVDDANK